MAASHSVHSSRLMCLCALLAVALVAPERPRTAVAERVVAAAPRADRIPGPGGEAPALPAGAAPDWWTAVRAQIEREAYVVRPVTGIAAGTFEADNPAQRWQARFTPMGVAITPARPLARDRRAPGHARLSTDTGSPAADAPATESGSGAAALPHAEDWTLGLRLAAYGAGDALTPVLAAAPLAAGARVEFRYGESHAGAPTLTEWYVNAARGLEHGFTLSEAPTGPGPVTLQLAVAGDLRPVLQPDGLAVELRAPGGAARARYADLFVTDASGRTLPSHMAVPAGESARIELVVDTSGAVYPVTIDPLLTDPPTTLTGEAANDSFGYSVATAGDVNGDGYADVVVGAFGYNSWAGRAYVFPGGPSGLATTAATTLTGQGPSNSFGYSVATAGDVNGDGYSDVVVGAYQYGSIGRAYVFLGGASGLLGGLSSGSAAMAATTLTGPALYDMFGLSVATAGDVNKDGYADVVVGAPSYSPYTGRAFVYPGGPSGLATEPLTTLTGPAGSSYFGYSVATAGDVNGDGYADVLVGARIVGDTSGQALLYLGGASGLATPAATTLTGEEQGSYFGESVAPAGDVNGDGYADVVIGAWGYSSLTGRAYVYLGEADGLRSTPATTLTGVASGDRFGYSVAAAGDLNGDGYADVVVGAWGDTSNTGRAYVYLGGASGLATPAATTLTGAAAGDQLGASVATAGDVNGDGYADLVVGAIGYSSFTGRAHVYLGGAGNLAAVAATTWTGEDTAIAFGASVATAGDVNGDGYADVVVGAPYYSGNTGRAYVYLGSAGGLETTPAATFTGEAANNYFGMSAATAGDVNGDGYADVVIGAFNYLGATGRAYVFLGGAGGLATTAATTLTGEATSNRFGRPVATAGDVNGDGYADVVVGAKSYSSGTGRAYVYLGGSGGLATTAATTLTGEATTNAFGASVATAGDVNGDGYADVVVGASEYSSVTGRAYVFLGGASGLATTAATTLTGEAINNYFGESVATAGDVNGDGYADVVVGAYAYSSSTGRAYVYLGGAGGLAATPATTLTGEAANHNLGGSVATAGDVNGDGYADLVLGAYRYSNGAGRVYVLLGRASGLPSGGVAAAASTTLTGGAMSYLGTSVATAGDVNGDGYADVVIGAYGYSSQTGRTYVYAGNGGLGVSLAPRTRRANDATPVAYGGRSDSANSFRIAALGRSPFGPTQVKLEWEVKPLGTLFNGSGTSRSADWQETTTVGASLNELAGGLAGDTPYHWRVRVRYHPAGNPFSQFGRWVTQPWVGSQETRLRTRPNSPPTASGVSITGAPVVGQVLTGTYTYGDVDGDAEGSSTFRWLRAGSAIAGATAVTYLASGADSDQTITFEVTPRAAAGATPGTPVASSGVIIARATPVITWANPASIVYGTALGATQLNATTIVAGSFVYTPAAGTVLNAGAGQTLSVTFTPTDTASYTMAAQTATIDVTKATPDITWANPASIVYGTALGATQLNATAIVPGTFVYSPSAGTVLSVGAGQTLSVTFTPTDPDNYTLASASVSLDVLPQPRVVRSDFTGDLKSDILWRHATLGDVWLWPMDGAARTAETFVRTVADTDWEIRGVGDQTGDGKADILWRNKTTGMIYFWPMDGTTVLSETYVATVAPAYDIVGTGDYNGTASRTSCGGT